MIFVPHCQKEYYYAILFPIWDGTKIETILYKIYMCWLMNAVAKNKSVYALIILHAHRFQCTHTEYFSLTHYVPLAHMWIDPRHIRWEKHTIYAC